MTAVERSVALFRAHGADKRLAKRLAVASVRAAKLPTLAERVAAGRAIKEEFRAGRATRGRR